MSVWDSRESIVAFAGDDTDRAVLYPEDDRYLIDRETTVKHFTVHRPTQHIDTYARAASRNTPPRNRESRIVGSRQQRRFMWTGRVHLAGSWH